MRKEDFRWGHDKAPLLKKRGSTLLKCWTRFGLSSTLLSTCRFCTMFITPSKTSCDYLRPFCNHLGPIASHFLWEMQQFRFPVIASGLCKSPHFLSDTNSHLLVAPSPCILLTYPDNPEVINLVKILTSNQLALYAWSYFSIRQSQKNGSTMHLAGKAGDEI